MRSSNTKSSSLFNLSNISSIWTTAILILIFVAGYTRVVYATTQTLTAISDNFLKKNDRNVNKGDYSLLKISEDQKSHVLVRFDQAAIASALNGVPLRSATLQAYIVQNWGGWTASGREVVVFRMTGQNGDWTEMGSTWNCPIDTNTSNGSADCAAQWDGGTRLSTATSQLQFYNNTLGWQSFNVTADVNAFLQGTTNYGWLVRKTDSFVSGDVDFSSLQGSDAGKKPRLVLDIDDPPSITAIVTPPPNQYGWNNTNVTVTYSCSDPDGISYCPPPHYFTVEGANQTYSDHATDSLGLSTSVSVTVSIDKTPPSVSISNPSNGVALTTSRAFATGTVSDFLSALVSVTCNGSAANINGGAFVCALPWAAGTNVITSTATDIAGNSAASVVSFAQAPGIVRILNAVASDDELTTGNSQIDFSIEAAISPDLLQPPAWVCSVNPCFCSGVTNNIHWTMTAVPTVTPANPSPIVANVYLPLVAPFTYVDISDDGITTQQFVDVSGTASFLACSGACMANDRYKTIVNVIFEQTAQCLSY